MPCLCFSKGSKEVAILFDQIEGYVNARVKTVQDSIQEHQAALAEQGIDSALPGLKFNYKENKIVSVTGIPLPFLRKIHAYHGLVKDLLAKDLGIITNLAQNLIICKRELYISKIIKNDSLQNKIAKIDDELNVAIATATDKLKVANKYLAIIKTIECESITQVISSEDDRDLIKQYIEEFDDTTEAAATSTLKIA